VKPPRIVPELPNRCVINMLYYNFVVEVRYKCEDDLEHRKSKVVSSSPKDDLYDISMSDISIIHQSKNDRSTNVYIYLRSYQFVASYRVIAIPRRESMTCFLHQGIHQSNSLPNLAPCSTTPYHHLQDSKPIHPRSPSSAAAALVSPGLPPPR
jgi:hypothetical protein